MEYKIVVATILLVGFTVKVIKTIFISRTSEDFTIWLYIPALMFSLGSGIGLLSMGLNVSTGVWVGLLVVGMSGIVNFGIFIKYPPKETICANPKLEKWVSLICGTYVLWIAIALV